MGMTITEIHDITKIDNWFLQRIFMMHTHAVAMQKMQLEQFDYDFFMEAKCLGFSGASIIQCPYKSGRQTHDAWSAFQKPEGNIGFGAREPLLFCHRLSCSPSASAHRSYPSQQIARTHCAHCTHALCTLHARIVHAARTHCAHCTHALCTLHARTVHTARTHCAHCTHALCTLHARIVHAARTHCARCTHALCTLHARTVHAARMLKFGVMGADGCC